MPVSPRYMVGCFTHCCWIKLNWAELEDSCRTRVWWLALPGVFILSGFISAFFSYRDSEAWWHTTTLYQPLELLNCCLAGKVVALDLCRSNLILFHFSWGDARERTGWICCQIGINVEKWVSVSEQSRVHFLNKSLPRVTFAAELMDHLVSMRGSLYNNMEERVIAEIQGPICGHG